MNRLTTLRLAASLGPVLLTYGLALLRRPSRRLMTGVLVAVAWNLWTLLALNAFALHLGWWSFAAGLPSFMGVPVELWLGWTVLWGVVAPVVALGRPVVAVAVAFLWFDLLVMPALEPLLVLHDGWLVGEAVALVAALIPGLVFARWTAAGTNLYGRVALQVATAGGMMLWLIPSLSLEGSGGWNHALELPEWQLGIGLQLLLLPLALGLRSVVEFAAVGRGTPIPYDPPQELVTSGPYSYVRNPMQVSMVVVFALSALVFRSVWLLGGALMAFAYGAGLATWHENLQLSARFGRDWIVYRSRVRSWIPRWRPLVAGDATLLVAYSCGTCTSVGRWFLDRDPIGLTVAPAETSDDPRISRITYVPATGPPARGVAAIARALEHIHLGWALVGWVLALPGVVHVTQLIADACGSGPQRVRGRHYDEAACVRRASNQVR